MNNDPSTRTQSDRPPLDEVERRFLAARDMAAETGRLLLEYFRGEFETHDKDQDSSVTDADLAAEELLRDRIARQFADDSVLGEEFGYERRGETWCWTLDPLDGTHNFAGGIPVFAVAIGVLHRRQPVLGVIHDPCRGETYAAMSGRGARLNGETLEVDPRPLDRRSLLAVRHRFMRGPRAPLLDNLPTHKFRCTGSLCLEMAYVAAGALHGSIAGSARLWEVVPGTVLIEEAGGVLRDLHNEVIFPLPEAIQAYGAHRFRILAGSSAVADELAAQLARVVP